MGVIFFKCKLELIKLKFFLVKNKVFLKQMGVVIIVLYYYLTPVRLLLPHAWSKWSLKTRKYLKVLTLENTYENT